MKKTLGAMLCLSMCGAIASTSAWATDDSTGRRGVVTTIVLPPLRTPVGPEPVGGFASPKPLGVMPGRATLITNYAGPMQMSTVVSGKCVGLEVLISGQGTVQTVSGSDGCSGTSFSLNYWVPANGQVTFRTLGNGFTTPIYSGIQTSVVAYDPLASFEDSSWWSLVMAAHSTYDARTCIRTNFPNQTWRSGKLYWEGTITREQLDCSVGGWQSDGGEGYSPGTSGDGLGQGQGQGEGEGEG